MHNWQPSRRQFLSLASLFCFGAAPAELHAGLFRRRRRARCCTPCDSVPPRPTQRVRQNIASLTAQQLESLKTGVDVMKSRPSDEENSWTFQAAIHGISIPSPNPLFNQCEHGSIQFFTWHRVYLYYFELILREASGDEQLTLPYWDWSTSPQLPEPFRNPADASNPLYDNSRFINDGSALPPLVVVDNLNAALSEIDFYPGGLGFSGLLEDSPHGDVHVLIGGNMGWVPTAANDPIFWLHHCNIDRIWDQWLNLGEGRMNPSDAAFLDTEYSFADVDGSTVTRRVGDIISSAGLGYRYDDVPNPMSLMRTAAKARMAMGGAQPEPMLAASTSEAADDTKRLGFESKTVALHIAPDNGAALLQAPAEGAAEQKILLRIRGLTFDEVPNFTYAVYLNLPADEEMPRRRERQYYVGTLNLFRGGHQEHDDKSSTKTFDATKVVARLRRAGQFKADDLNVTFRPVTPIPPRGREEDLQARSKAAADKANVRYESIELLVVPR